MLTERTMGLAPTRSFILRGERSMGHSAECVSARRMQSEQNVCAHVRVVIGSVNGARQMQHTYTF